MTYAGAPANAPAPPLLDAPPSPEELAPPSPLEVLPLLPLVPPSPLEVLPLVPPSPLEDVEVLVEDVLDEEPPELLQSTVRSALHCSCWAAQAAVRMAATPRSASFHCVTRRVRGLEQERGAR